MNKNYTAIKGRMLYYAELKEINKSDFNQLMGVTNNTFRSIRVQTDTPSSLVIKFLELFPEINPEWLLMGINPMLRVPSSGHINDLAPPTNNQGIPLITINAYEGFVCGKFNHENYAVKEYYQIPKFVKRGIDFLFEVESATTSSCFSPGDFIGCKLEVEVTRIRWNEPYLISTTNGDLLIKRINQGTSKKVISLVSDNASFGAYEIPTNEIKGLAVIMGNIR